MWKKNNLHSKSIIMHNIAFDRSNPKIKQTKSQIDNSTRKLIASLGALESYIKILPFLMASIFYFQIKIDNDNNTDDDKRKRWFSMWMISHEIGFQHRTYPSETIANGTSIEFPLKLWLNLFGVRIECENIICILWIFLNGK